MPRHILALGLLTLIGCGSQEETDPQPTVSAPPNAKIPATPQPAVPAPHDAKPQAPYTITSDLDEGPERRLVDVKLNKKVTPEVLHEIALEVKAKEERPHERTDIYYYLPAEFPEIAGLPWASTRFNPSLDVKILGFSMEEEDAMRKLPLDHKGKRIGAWLPDDHYKTLDLIYEQEGVVKIAEIRSATERSDSDMTDLPSSTGGRSFVKVKGSNIYEIDQAGNLRISNAQGQVFSAARPMR
jgi:hypothetical protein